MCKGVPPLGEKTMASASTDCVFCQLVAGHLPLSLVYQDDIVLAIMDIRPVTLGHIIIIPRGHFVYLSDVPEETWGRMALVGRKVGEAIRRSGVPCEGINLFYADGKVAGQVVFHSHLHVIPRTPGDGFRVEFRATNPPREDLDRVGRMVSQAYATIP